MNGIMQVESSFFFFYRVLFWSFTLYGGFLVYLLCLYAIIFCSFIQSAHDQEIEIGGGQVILRSHVSEHLKDRYGASLEPELNKYLEYRKNQSWPCADIKQLQRYALISVAFQEESCFTNITKCIKALDPTCINDYYPSGMTLLLSMVNGGKLNPVLQNMTQYCMSLFGAHLDINKGVKDCGTSPLFFTAQEGDRLTCELLLQRKVKIDHSRNDGTTPFAIAAEWGHMEVLELFKKYRKDIKVNNCSDHGMTPLIASISSKRDVNTGSLVQVSETVPMYLVSIWGADVNLGNHIGVMPLFLAVLNQKFDLADFLVTKKAKCDYYLPQYNYNVLHYIGVSADGIICGIPRDISIQNVPKLKSLIQKIIGKNNKHLFNGLTSYGDAPSHLVATSENAPNLMKAFFEGAKSVGVVAANIPDRKGRTALHKVVLKGEVAVVKCLLGQGANPWIQDKEGNNALDVAQTREDNDAIIALLQDQMKKVKPPVAAKQENKKQPTHTKQKSVGQKPAAQCKSSSSLSSSATASTSSNQVAKRSLEKVKIDPSSLFSFSTLKAPDGVIALRQNTGASKILIGYTVKDSPGKFETIDASRYAPSACKTGDLYHEFNTDIDPYIIKDGHAIAADKQEAFQDLLTKYSIKIREGNTAYVLPGRIEGSCYDVRYALKDKDQVDPFRSHSGAFVLIENKNGTIVHRQFHPSQEQKIIRSALQ